MDILTTIGLLLGMALVTYGLRVSFFLPGVGERFPPVLRQAASYVPVAVLTAIITPEIFMTQGHWQALSPQLGGCIATGLIVWRSKKLMLGIVLGMAVYYALRLL
ncbi:AzlD domain-containing protein [Deefgea salmonis]|uniref:AzlD domain-containing protein n=1 Tax=Deefgea salmonis TaxID=2875502 RepID=A0ABS8BJA9_9NEIS|nr:AzlD domain-containing protein [Deefgea salmonis]MCB5195813.1 AzlD domain-containing protein [Deefgea salmonis]